MSKVLFIGAPGFISVHAVNEACRLGHTVAVFKRTETLDDELACPVARYAGDRDSRADLEAAVSDFHPDEVVDFVCYKAYQAELIAELLRDRVGHYIFVSSCDYYGLPLSRLPWKEEYGMSGPATTEYAISKRECEAVFMKRHRETGFPATIARPCYSIHKRAILSFFSGRDWNREGGWSLVQRLKGGKPVVVPGDGTTLFQAGSAHNHGRMVAWLIAKDFTIGEAFNCVPNEVTTSDQYMATIAKVLGVEPRVVHIPTDVLLRLGLKEVESGYVPILLRYNSYFSSGKFASSFPDFKWEWSLEDAIREYVQWHEGKAPVSQANGKEVEDRILGAWQESFRDILRRL